MTKNLVIVAGPNGAGKTTFARDYLQEHPGAVFQLVSFGDTAGYEVADEESFDIFMKDVGFDEQKA
jgi:predicted ABC-type ATPase